MIAAGTGPVAYILKRYPRLSETFILNEICAMERLGCQLQIFSLLQPEPPPHHPMVADVRAGVTHVPASWAAKMPAMAQAHACALAASPRGYLRAVLHAVRLAAESGRPVAVARHFLRAGFFTAAAYRLGIRHIHAHFANTPSEVARMMSLMSGLPFSFTTHAKDLYLTAPRRIAERTAAARFVVTCTGHNVAYLRGILPPGGADKVSLVYHGVDFERFRFRLPPDAAARAWEPRSILSVGRLVPKKGFDDLIAACALLRERGVVFRCRIVGAGPLREALTADIAARGLGDCVALLGPMTHARLIEKFEAADVFALASRVTDDGDRDGIPNVVAEAMAIGVPVVAAAVSGIPEVVRDEQTGLLVAPRDPVALAAAIARLLGNLALARRLARTARARLETCFDCWQTATQLQELLGAAAKPPRDRLRCDAVADLSASAGQAA
ncbi:MAG TPA: glycosyltransferase [Acetobacteraceae bacterium]|nr:glycosyltransferase [Acetobacteraceae bacterium]